MLISAAIKYGLMMRNIGYLYLHICNLLHHCRIDFTANIAQRFGLKLLIIEFL